VAEKWPEFVDDFRGFEAVAKIADEVVAAEQALGLDNVEPDVVAQLL
jgi:hypothetical protein